MKRLHEKVNVIPLIAKADTLTPEECQQFKKQVSGFHSCTLLQKKKRLLFSFCGHWFKGRPLGGWQLYLQHCEDLSVKFANMELNKWLVLQFFYVVCQGRCTA